MRGNEADVLEKLEGAMYGTNRKARPDREVGTEGEAGRCTVAL